MDHRNGSRGFTLLELLIVLAVLAIVLTLSAPPMIGLLRGAQLHSEVQRLQLALNLARTEAVSRNRRVTLCPSPYAEGGEPNCEGDFSSGWLVFADAQNDEQFDPLEDELIRVFSAVPDGFQVRNRAGLAPVATALTYYPDGATRRNLTFMFCPPGRVVTSSLSVVVSRVGRPRVARDWGDCP